MTGPSWVRLHAHGITHWTPDGDSTMCSLTINPARAVQGESDARCPLCVDWQATYTDLIAQHDGDRHAALAHLLEMPI